MSSLTEIDKRYFEKLFGMPSGYVLDYSDTTFGAFFDRHNVNIHSYQKYGTSKAKKLRAFWEEEPDPLVATVLGEMLDSYETDCVLNARNCQTEVLTRCRDTVARLTGKEPANDAKTDQTFLDKEFRIPNIDRLPVEHHVAAIIAARLDEAVIALGAGAHLSVIFLCGSVLEAVLLGVAQSTPERFNRAQASLKNGDGKVRPLHEWSLAHFIDVACEVGVLQLDVKKFSHGLRDFRNYIHPYEQMMSGFRPDQHTAKVCFQVLKAALASVAGER